MLQYRTNARERRKPPAPDALLGDIRALIDAARQRAVAAVNHELTMLFWRIGLRIHTQVLSGHRAGYGEEFQSGLVVQLVRDYGRGFSGKNLRAFHTLSNRQIPHSQSIRR
jgi:hypothetical protein